MTANEFLARLRQTPFEPFRIHISDGSSYDVRHPEMAAVSQRTVAVAFGPIKEGVPDRLAYCDLLHITRVEPLNGTQEEEKPRKRKRR